MRNLTISFLLTSLLYFIGKHFRAFQILGIWSSSVYPPKEFKETICVKTWTTKLACYLISLGFKFLS
jgi:hypothetical protein